MSELINNIFDSVLDGDREGTLEAVQAALDKGTAAADILNKGMIEAMEEVGKLFEEGEYFVPEMLIAARAMQAGLELLNPHLMDADIIKLGKIVLGTVKGDLHDIGKNLVGMMFEGKGFEVVDLGTDVSADQFVEAVKAHQPDIVGMSALLTTTMPAMKVTIEALQSAGLRDKVKVMVGGAPVTQQFAESIGADGYSPDASRAATLAKTYVTST